MCATLVRNEQVVLYASLRAQYSCAADGAALQSRNTGAASRPVSPPISRRARSARRETQMVLPDRFWPWKSLQWAAAIGAVFVINKNVRPHVAGESFVDRGEMRIRLGLGGCRYQCTCGPASSSPSQGGASVRLGATAAGTGIVLIFPPKERSWTPGPVNSYCECCTAELAQPGLLEWPVEHLQRSIAPIDSGIVG